VAKHVSVDGHDTAAREETPLGMVTDVQRRPPSVDDATAAGSPPATRQNEAVGHETLVAAWASAGRGDVAHSCPPSFETRACPVCSATQRFDDAQETDTRFVFPNVTEGVQSSPPSVERTVIPWPGADPSAQHVALVGQATAKSWKTQTLIDEEFHVAPLSVE
jgi:hypothetical protein